MGNYYEHPINLLFENPIVAIYDVALNNSRLKFETKDGIIGKHNPEPS